MAEPDPRDLQRLQSLEERLSKAQGARKELATERKELRATITEHTRRVRDLEKEGAAAKTQIAAVLAENRSLATQLDEVTRDRERFRDAAQMLRENADALEPRLKAAEGAAADAQGARASAEKERDGLTQTLRAANEQLAGKQISPVLPAADVAKLIDELVGGLSASLPGLNVRDGEMRLKVAFGEVGGETGFVMPSATSPPELRENLHELALRFDRSDDAEPQR